MNILSSLSLLDFIYSSLYGVYQNIKLPLILPIELADLVHYTEYAKILISCPLPFFCYIYHLLNLELVPYTELKYKYVTLLSFIYIALVDLVHYTDYAKI